LRSGEVQKDWWNESKSKWGEKTTNYDDKRAPPIYKSETESPASGMFQDIDWRQAIGLGVFLLFFFSDLIFS